jgi:predicted nucleotidyltransferase
MDIMTELRRRHKIVCDHYGADRVLATFLYGSQNYKLDTEKSDIDTQSIIIPSISELLSMRQPINFYNNLEDKSLMGHRDLRILLHDLTRAESTMMQLLYTEYRIINPAYYAIFSELILHREKIAECNKAQILYAQIGEAKSFTTRMGEKVRVKDYVNLFRIADFMQQFFVEGKRYGESIVPHNYEILRKIKESCNDPHKLDNMVQSAQDSIEIIKKTYEQVLKNEKEELGFIREIGNKIFEKYLRNELK